MASKGSISRQALVLLLVFSCVQFYVVFARGGANPSSERPAPQAITGRLTTRGNQPVTVNGNPATTGATIMSGATIETGDQVGATIDLGPLGSIELAPNTKVQIEFSDGQIKVTIIQGCAIVRNKKGISAQVYTEKGLAASNDPNQKPEGALDVCLPVGAPAPIVNQGAAANAGAGAGAGGAGAAGGGGGLFGLGTTATFAILGGGAFAAVTLPLALSGSNPSPTTP
jgi:hypothetical protein